MNFLDLKVGKDQYFVFLSADHGVAHVPQFALEHNIPAGKIDFGVIEKNMDSLLQAKFGKNDLVKTISNYQVVLNLPLIQTSSLNANEIKEWIINYLSKQQGIARVFDIDGLSTTTLNSKIKQMASNGYYPERCGQIQFILQTQFMESYSPGGTTHGLWNPYDSHIPLLWYGWGVKPGKTNRELYMTDIAPTVAALLHIQMPSGCVGTVIEEIFK
jgi:hypothetical protein